MALEVVVEKAHPTKKPDKKYPLRGKPVVYRHPFEGVDFDQSKDFSRVPGADRAKVVIKPDFDEPLPEFDL